MQPDPPSKISMRPLILWDRQFHSTETETETMDQAQPKTKATTEEKNTNISRNVAGKMLSRNELYSPLVAYEQTRVAPSSYMMSQPSIPKSLRESALVSFLQKASRDYHRYDAKAGDPKNNGSRPTSHADVESKIKQRAVTLIGGGVTSSLASGMKAPKKSRKRKRKSWKDVEETLKQQSQISDELPSRIDSVQFLKKLNSNWNNYISCALKLNKATKKPSTIAASFIVQRTQLELIGAHVRIATCSQRQGWKGRYGVLIGDRQNTWQIATLRLKAETSSSRKSTESDELITKRTVDTLIVPKRGSTLILVVRTPSSTTDSISDDASERGDELISLPKQSICITLDPAKNNSS
jgi:RNase P/RNase MRP subunit p29